MNSPPITLSPFTSRMINMAALIPKVVRTIRNQNVCPGIYAIQSCDYSSSPRIIKNPTTASLKRGTGGRSSFNGIVCTVFGCSGFIGSALCIRLGRIGTQLILPHRCDPYHIRELKVGGDLGQVFFHPFDFRDEESLIRTMKYSNVVINLVGTNYETSNFSFEDVHVEGARKLAKIAKELNVERFIHMSCLNAEEKPTPMILKEGSKLLKTKWEGELAVKEEFPEATIIRPSVVYGRADKFINHYLNRKRTLFYNDMPLWHKGEKTEKQPVYLHDVISGIVEIVRNSDTAGKTYQFVGPKRYKLNELITMMVDEQMKDFVDKTRIVDMKYNLYAWLKTSLIEYLYAIHPVTDMMWEVLEFHHTSDKIDRSLPTLEDLGITPTQFESRIGWEVVPHVPSKPKLEELQKLAPVQIKSVPK